MSVVVFAYEKKTGLQPAVGRHAEVLREISQQAEALVRFIALEQSGYYDDLGQAAWVASDPIDSTVQRLAGLLEQRNGAIRDAALRR
jgi:hypothetical protein